MLTAARDVEGGVWGMKEESQMEDEGKLCLKGAFMLKPRGRIEVEGWRH